MKLHLGCGERYIEGYVHIDAIKFPHVDHVYAVDSLPFIQDNTVDVIYNCHILEHFHRCDVERVLREWKRVLKPNGILRISVPDMMGLCEHYVKHRNLEDVVYSIFGGADYMYNFHYNAFDYQSLSDLLRRVGFKGIRPYDWRQTEHAHVPDFSQAYPIESLNVECFKE
jgi:predicted SAM-dependent methyltransferase